METCLAGVLRAYLVDERSDMPVMSAILKKHTQNEREKPRVVASKFLGEVRGRGAGGVGGGDDGMVDSNYGKIYGTTRKPNPALPGSGTTIHVLNATVAWRDVALM